MQIRTISLTLVAAIAIGTTASAQTPSTATPGAVEPSMAFAGHAAVALRNNGDVLTWGANYSCLLGRVPTGSSPSRPDPTPTVVMHNAKAIATSGDTIAVLTAEGKVYSWGHTFLPMASGYWLCDGPAPVASLEGKVVTHIGLGEYLAVAVTDSGDLYCTGGSLGCPANLTRNPDSSFKANGAGPAAFTRLSLPELNGNILDIRVGGSHTLVLTKDRKLYAFGASQAGQLGDSRFTPRGASSGVTPEPVLTNVVSFAAGRAHSVAVKDDGTVWTWGRNGEASALCDGTAADRRVPTQLPALAGRVVGVSANLDSTFLRTAEGALYACGGDSSGQLGLAAPGTDSTKWTPIPRPTQVQGPVAKTSMLVVSGEHAAFSPDGCSVYIAGVGPNVRGASEPRSPRFALRAGLSLCAPQSATPMPDVAAGALHRVPPAPPGVDCWIPKHELGSKDPKLEPLRKAVLTVERLVKDNRAFTIETPEGVRMDIATTESSLVAQAFPQQVEGGPLLYWTPRGCDIVRTSRNHEFRLGEIIVNLNTELSAALHHAARLVRVVAGIPVFRYVTGTESADVLIITKDGRLPFVPVTLADRLDREAAYLAKRLEEVRKQLAAKPQASVKALLQPEEAEFRREIDALAAYRASFSADELGAAWVQHKPQAREVQEQDARIKALEALSPEDQAQVNALGARVRTLQLQARARGVAPEEATRLRNEATEALQQARVIEMAQKTRVKAQVRAMGDDFEMKLIRPGAAADATELKDDPTFYDPSDPTRIRLITVSFTGQWATSRETSRAQAEAWMAKVEATFDYAALKALIR